jgi:D-glycerate 3-kinase
MSGLDPGLIETIGRWIARFDPSGPPPILGIAGSQGSGKSTLAQAVADRFGGASLSLDDVYLMKAERVDLARRVHPLFATRGPPGTHDLSLLNGVLDRLRTARPGEVTPLPRFDKLADDRRPQADWPVVEGRPGAVVLEGWCLGATPQVEAVLTTPFNDLERERDPDGIWRRAVNAALAAGHASLRGRLDALVFLKAPSFDVVLDWRCEQEAGLMGVAAVSDERRAELAVFVQHYERLTRHMLDGGIDADLTMALDGNRQVAASSGRLAG